MRESDLVQSSVRFASFLVGVGRKHWVAGLIVLSIVVAATVAAGLGRKVESWTASSTMSIGTLPTLEGVIAQSSPVVAPIEASRDLVKRISRPEFQSAVIARVQEETGSQAAPVQGTLRGVVLDDAKIRLEATAASRDAAVALLRHSVVRIQSDYRALSEPRLRLLNEVRGGLLSTLKILDDSLKERSRVSHALSEPNAADQLVSDRPRNNLDQRVGYQTRIAALNFIESTIIPTEPQGGFIPSIEGPREVNLVGRALLAGLAVLFFALVFMLLLRVRNGRA